MTASERVANVVVQKQIIYLLKFDPMKLVVIHPIPPPQDPQFYAVNLSQSIGVRSIDPRHQLKDVGTNESQVVVVTHQQITTSTQDERQSLLVCTT